MCNHILISRVELGRHIAEPGVAKWSIYFIREEARTHNLTPKCFLLKHMFRLMIIVFTMIQSGTQFFVICSTKIEVIVIPFFLPFVHRIKKMAKVHPFV